MKVEEIKAISHGVTQIGSQLYEWLDVTKEYGMLQFFVRLQELSEAEDTAL